MSARGSRRRPVLAHVAMSLPLDLAGCRGARTEGSRTSARAAEDANTRAAVDGQVTAGEYAPDAAWLAMPCDEQCHEAPGPRATDRRS